MISVHTFSEVGGHRENEDAFAVEQHPLNPNLWLCFVADGQGGRAGGGRAAQLACQTALAAAKRCEPSLLLHPRAWSALLRAADMAVNQDSTAGYTTLIAFGVAPRSVQGSSNGDSAVVLVSSEEFAELTASQRKNPPVGSSGAIPTTFAVSVRSPCKIIAMSDGVWKYAGMDRVIALARREGAAEFINAIQQVARLPGNHQFQDDFTIVVFEYTDEVGVKGLP